MQHDYRIDLNFLPVEKEQSFLVFRRAQGEAVTRPADGAFAYKLPNNLDDSAGTWQQFWISTQPLNGFEKAVLGFRMNVRLTLRIISLSLTAHLRSTLNSREFNIPERSFLGEIYFNKAWHPEGIEQLVVQPYYLQSSRQLGLLVDFRFRLAADAKFNKRIQQLSLSLDRTGRRNLDFYLEKTTKIRTFLEESWPVLSSVRLPGNDSPLTIANKFIQVKAGVLRSKVYVFGPDLEAQNQYQGIRRFGPLKRLRGPTKLLFVFREEDRQPARTLAIALRGGRNQESIGFPGFQQLFGTPLDIDHEPVILKDLSQAQMEIALARAEAECNKHQNLVAVIILPDHEEEGYIVQKALFSHVGIPTQVCTLRVLREPDTLKWAIGNLALQVFCKAGGQPWKVKPTQTDRTLIVGISQSHKLHFDGAASRVEKYFAFSVLTDSSGIFQEIQVLGESASEVDYLASLRQSLSRILSDRSQAFDRVVIHTTYKLKHAEMDAIAGVVRDTASQTSTCRFAVVKINHRSNFFGTNPRTNSLVPYEATLVALGGGEYLVWFEGILPRSSTVTKVFSGPSHIQFLRLSDDAKHSIPDELLLQDLVNLSGANWRGFNAKGTPVSVFYCHLVAGLVHDFHERGLPLPAIKDLNPWFL